MIFIAVIKAGCYKSFPKPGFSKYLC